MAIKIKDAADLFAAERENARETVDRLKAEARDALEVTLSEAPKGSNQEHYRYVRENVFSLLQHLEDPSERGAALDDVASSLKLGKRNLRKAFSEFSEAQEQPDDGEPEENPAPEPGSERYERAMRLLKCPDVLLGVARDMERLGHVGERNNKQLAFVCAVSAKAGRPIQPSTHAQSSAGKNYLWDIVLSLLPEDMVIRRSGLSAKALFRTEADLKGKVLYIQEVAGSEEAEFTIRILQSDGRLVYEATEKGSDGSMRNVVHEKEGPTIVVQTTTKIHLHPENETRVFPIYIDESAEQTDRIVQSVLAGAVGRGPNAGDRERIMEGWRDAVRLLEPAEVVIPYAGRIEVPTSQVRMRRDVSRLLDVIRVVAWLHQHGRERDEMGRILATEADFQKALELASEPLSRSWQALTPAEEAVMEAVRALGEAKQNNGFKRRDLKVKGVSPRRIQEVLQSLAASGHLDCDGRGGSQGYTYTLAQDPEQITLGITLRASRDEPDNPVDEPDTGAREVFAWSCDPRDADTPDEEEPARGSRENARKGARASESPYSRAEDPNARSGGGETAEDYGETGATEADSQPPWEEDHDDDEQEEDGQEARALEKLTERGWFRSQQPLGLGVSEPPLTPEEVEQDPMTYDILFALALYSPEYLPAVGIYTDTELLEGWSKYGATDDQHALVDRPKTPKQAHARFVRMLPALQAKRFYPDPYVAKARRDDPEAEACKRAGYLHVERWENEGSEEGFWAFLPIRPGWRAPDTYIEEYILESFEWSEARDGAGDFDFDFDED